MSDPVQAPIPTLQLAKEVVATQALGEVVVRGLRLSQRLALNRAFREDEAAAAADLFTARLLAVAVVTKDGKAVYGEDEWDIFGAQHPADTNALVTTALRLSGFDREEAKNG
jgi:hypothetical protein